MTTQNYSMELLRLAEDRAVEQFPQAKIRPVSAWYSGGVYRCTVYADNVLAVGYGHNMNACCDMLIGSIEDRKKLEPCKMVEIQ